MWSQLQHGKLSTRQTDNLLLCLILAAAIFTVIGFVDVCVMIWRGVQSWI